MDTIYRSRVTTRLTANRITSSLPFCPYRLLRSALLRVLSTVVSFSRPIRRVPLFTFRRPSSKRPRAKQTYGVLTLNKLSDFVIGLPQSAADGNRKNALASRRDGVESAAAASRETRRRRSSFSFVTMRRGSLMRFTAYRINRT